MTPGQTSEQTSEQTPNHASERTGGQAWLQAMRTADFPAAFRANDTVLRLRDPATRDDPARPYHERWLWDGQPPDGRAVLVRCYHGLGDTLQFARYLVPLARRAAHLTVEVQPELLPLLHQLPGPDRWCAFDPAAPLPPAECTVEIMELAHLLRQPPDPAPYLSAPPSGPPARVGFCWSAGGWDERRDIPYALLRPLIDQVAGQGVQLQRGPARVPTLPDPLEGSMDMVRLAGLIAGLAAVVTVDTMVAHLAGALGRPVFLLLKHGPDWRWARERTWYATARHYTQDPDGDWHGAVRRLGQDLRGTLDRTNG